MIDRLAKCRINEKYPFSHIGLCVCEYNVCDDVWVSVLLPLCMYVWLSVCFYLHTFD